MPKGRSRFGGVREFGHLWLTYGADGTERVKRLVIAAGATAVLVAALSVLTGALPLGIAGHAALADGIVANFRPRDFAYVMTIVTALTAAACTGFFIYLVPQANDTPTEEHDVRWSLTALMISLVAAIAATLGFAAIYASGSTSQQASTRIREFHMLVMAFAELTISLALVSVTIIPVVSNRPGPILGSIVSAISAFWWLPTGWMVCFLLAMPEIWRVVAGTFGILLFLTMAQIYYPHGWQRAYHEESYLPTMRWLMHLSFFMLGGCIILSGYFIIADIIWHPAAIDYYAWTTSGLFIVVGLALWCYSTSTEGKRKHARYTLKHVGTLERRR